MKMLEFKTEPWAELITRQEYNSLLSQKKPINVYIGMEPSFSYFHIGHCVALLPLMYLKSKFPSQVRPIMLLADKHAILDGKGTEEEIEGYTQDLKREFKKYFSKVLPDTKIVIGSDFQNTEEYWNDVFLSAPKVSEVDLRKSAAETVDEKIMKSGAPPLYTLMQAIDIKHLKADIAVGGPDQRPTHLRIARPLLPQINYKSPVCIHTDMLLSLESKFEKNIKPPKMSKSRPLGAIFLGADEFDVMGKIDRTFCPPGKLEPNPIKELYKHLFAPFYSDIVIDRPPQFGEPIMGSPQEIINLYEEGKIHSQDFKESAKNCLIEVLHYFR